jgi:hypothetical protein
MGARGEGLGWRPIGPQSDDLPVSAVHLLGIGEKRGKAGRLERLVRGGSEDLRRIVEHSPLAGGGNADGAPRYMGRKEAEAETDCMALLTVAAAAKKVASTLRGVVSCKP